MHAATLATQHHSQRGGFSPRMCRRTAVNGFELKKQKLYHCLGRAKKNFQKYLPAPLQDVKKIDDTSHFWEVFGLLTPPEMSQGLLHYKEYLQSECCISKQLQKKFKPSYGHQINPSLTTPMNNLFRITESLYVWGCHRTGERILQCLAGCALWDDPGAGQAFIFDDDRISVIFLTLLVNQYRTNRVKSVWGLHDTDGTANDCYTKNQAVLKLLVQIVNGAPRRIIHRRGPWVRLANTNLTKNKNSQFDCHIMCYSCMQVLGNIKFYLLDDLMCDSCRGYNGSYDSFNSKILLHSNNNAARNVIKMYRFNQHSVVAAALRAVGNIVTGDDVQTQVILNCSALPCLLHLLGSPKESIRKEACWTISNITAGNRSQIQTVIDTNIFPVLIDILGKAEFKTRKEAAWAITNATSGGTPAQIRYLVEQGCIPPLCDLLTVMDAKIVQVALNGIQNILQLGEQESKNTFGVNPYAVLVEECYGLDKIEFLQSHENLEIYQKAFEIIEHYFGGEEEDSKVAPSVDESGQQFQFNPEAGTPPQGGFNF
ncbi:unnamed protein product, partial [Meganyctiphanes norvegica]